MGQGRHERGLSFVSDSGVGVCEALELVRDVARLLASGALGIARSLGEDVGGVPDRCDILLIARGRLLPWWIERGVEILRCGAQGCGFLLLVVRHEAAQRQDARDFGNGREALCDGVGLLE